MTDRGTEIAVGRSLAVSVKNGNPARITNSLIRTYNFLEVLDRLYPRLENASAGHELFLTPSIYKGAENLKVNLVVLELLKNESDQAIVSTIYMGSEDLSYLVAKNDHIHVSLFRRKLHQR